MAKEKSSPTFGNKQKNCKSEMQVKACIQPLRGYEYDAMWMSYRYAIGRHTAASVIHAENLVKAVYHRLDEKQREFNAYDMRREINWCLQISYHFGLDLYIPEPYYDPFKALYEFSLKPEVIEAGGILKYLCNHQVKVSIGTQNEYVYNEEKSSDASNELFSMGIDDLLKWANAANALDSSKHLIATIAYQGAIEEMEVYERLSFRPNTNGVYSFSKHYSSIEKLSLDSWIADEYITKLKPIKKQN